MIGYLDNAATTKVNKDVWLESQPYIMDMFGNPSSNHKLGYASMAAIELAREKVAKAINADSKQIFFFSSATEANNAVLNNYNICTCSPYEHSSVYYVYKGYDCIPELHSHMMVNNETGDVFDVKTLCQLCHERDIDFHTDATQAFGKVPIDVKDLDVDYLTLSGHKIHSLKGCAVLYIKNPDKFSRSLSGGHQENGIHPGTENVPAIVAIGKACELFNYNEDTKYKSQVLYYRCLAKFADSGLEYAINGISTEFVYTIINISFKDIDGETLQDMLSHKGVYVSTSSACSSGIKKSRVLDNMNVPEDYIYGAIRISFSLDDITNRYSDYKEEVLDEIDTIIETVKLLKELSDVNGEI